MGFFRNKIASLDRKYHPVTTLRILILVAELIRQFHQILEDRIQRNLGYEEDSVVETQKSCVNRFYQLLLKQNIIGPKILTNS